MARTMELTTEVARALDPATPGPAEADVQAADEAGLAHAGAEACAAADFEALRSRVLRDGPDGLAAADLLRLLCSGCVPERTRAALETQELAYWSRASASQLVQAFGLPPRSAVSLVAAFALGRLVEGEVVPERTRLNSPALVHRLMAPRLRGLPVETLHVLLLDGKHRLRRVVRVSEGTLTSAMVHPREVFAPALREGAAALIAVHNHPSGDPDPSEDDVRVTRRLIDTGTMVGVPLLDHVVVAGNGWVSLRERLRWDP